MSAEWQARQLLFIASAPGPSGNIPSPGGRSTLTDCNESWLPACVQNGARAKATAKAIVGKTRVIVSSSGDHNLGPLDDIPHEPARITIWRVGLHLAAAASAADHQHQIALPRRGKTVLPLAETVLPLIRGEFRLLPTCAPITREVDLRYSCIAAKCDAAGKR